ncbi:MAG: hypothetical protein LWW86_04860 [Micrococcales bacterium]|nr:hypothetical protein [Micrococcales bacterium]
MSNLAPRLMGILTLAYGAYSVARPDSMLRTAGLSQGATPTAIARAIGVRDVLSGGAMMAAPPGPALRAAVTARVLCDAADTVGFGLACPPRTRGKVMAIAAGWGALCAATLPWTRH